MATYECMFILRPDLTEEAVEAAITRLLGLIGELGGTVENVDRWGKRRLAYEINDLREGIYTIIKFHSEPGTTTELERNLKLAPEVIRYMVVKLGS